MYKLLGLCCFTNHWSTDFQVENHDLKNGKDVFNLPDDYGRTFDFIVAAPPCDQFTIANNRNWKTLPEYQVKLAKKCLTICQLSGHPWILETTIGRIEKLIPELTKFRAGIWQSRITTKRHTLYSNILLLFPIQKGNQSIVKHRSVTWRESWQPDLVADLQNCFTNGKS